MKGLIVILGIFMIISCTTPKKIAFNEIEKELSDLTRKKEGFYSNKDFEKLPALIRSHFVNSGYVGKPKESNLSIVYDKSFIRMDTTSKWLKINCEHYLFTNPNTRIVYLKAHILKIFPFEGRDRYKEGKGNMLGTIVKLIKVFDAAGSEMNQSALVTFLSEILFLPSICISDKVVWEQINENSAQAILEDSGLKVKGVFYFNEQGQFEKFTTNDRFEDKTPCLWTVRYENYKDFNGLLLPKKGIATWNYSNQDFDYFIANLKDFKYNVDKIK